jgi:hypothetical protein
MHVIVADIDGVTRRRSLRRKKKEKKEREKGRKEREGRERKRESLRRKMDSFESVDNQLTQAACKTTEGQKMGGGGFCVRMFAKKFCEICVSSSRKKDNLGYHFGWRREQKLPSVPL